MNGTKLWYLSRGCVGGIVAALAGVGAFAGHVNDSFTNVAAALQSFLTLMAAVGGIVAFIGRVRAKHTIVFTQGDPR